DAGDAATVTCNQIQHLHYEQSQAQHSSASISSNGNVGVAVMFETQSYFASLYFSNSACSEFLEAPARISCRRFMQGARS
uniref:Uncharacterized protein n=1 Tax=Ciona intestinalis TaxID=7719 RepID=F6T460_CIOIN